MLMLSPIAAFGPIALSVALAVGTSPTSTPPTGTQASGTHAPSPGPKAPIPLADYLDVRRARDASFSHDERFVAYRSDAGGRFNVWVQPVGGGEARQVTQVDGVIHSFAFSPTRDVLLYEVDQGGNDVTRIYATDHEGRAPRQLMPEWPQGARVGFIAWSQDGGSFLYIVNLPDQDFVELFVYDFQSGQSRKLWKSPANLSFALASRDLRRLILQEVRSDVDFNLYLWDEGASEPTLLTPHEGAVAYTPTALSEDGQTLYFTSTEGREFTGLYKQDLRTRQIQPVQQSAWDVETGYASPAGRYFVTVVNADGTPEVTLRRQTDGGLTSLPLPAGETGVLVPIAFSRTSRYVAARLVSDTAPETVYVTDLEQQRSVRLLDPLPASLRGRPMVKGEAVRIRSFDGREVPAFLYKPAGRGPFPAVIDVHGGPNAQATRAFSGVRQYLLSKGYVVLVPNVRGSTGYGKTYAALDNLDLGGGPLQDILACKRWLSSNAGVDGARVAVMGASYGGYMALAAAAFAPEEFAAHVDYFGISDLKSFVESFPPYWAVYSPFAHQKYGNPKDPAHARYQHERSPLNFVERMRRPLLVVQGANDAQVRKDQSDRLVKALEGRDVPVYYLVIPGEGHGFSKATSRLRAYEATDRFLDRHLLGDTTVQVLP
jgi:dipeptidyl aminopeptidase/acylaminoacyl peptidase